MPGRRLVHRKVLRAWAAASLALLMAAGAPAATPVYKCDVNGTVSFQSTPCPSGERRPQPSVERLNAEAKKRREAEAAKPAPPPIVPAAPQFKCDGRRYCSQMHSCEEATWFLKHCPDVKMDGNHDGVPCESQWCGR